RRSSQIELAQPIGGPARCPFDGTPRLLPARTADPRRADLLVGQSAGTTRSRPRPTRSNAQQAPARPRPPKIQKAVVNADSAGSRPRPTVSAVSSTAATCPPKTAPSE